MATTNPPSLPSSTAAADERVSPSTIQRAVNSLIKWRKSKSGDEKPKLLDQDGEEEFIYLVLTLKKIPQKGRVNPHKIPLPHSLLPEFSELCLIIHDKPKFTLTKEAALKKIGAENLPISNVLKTSKLKSDYRPFESRRKLCDSYHTFFADKRAIPLLPKLLGKHFFSKKKIPVPLDLKKNNWKEQIERACNSTMLFLSSGTCSVVKVGKLSMDLAEIVENVVAAIYGIVEVVPKNWANVRSFHLKLSESLALPIHQAVPNMKLEVEGVQGKEKDEKENRAKEIDSNEDKKDGNLGKKKGRIHQLQYMDKNGTKD